MHINRVKICRLTVSEVDVVTSFISDVGLKVVDRMRTNRDTIKCSLISISESEDHPAQARKHTT